MSQKPFVGFRGLFRFKRNFGVHVVAEQAGAGELTVLSGDPLPGSHVCAVKILRARVSQTPFVGFRGLFRFKRNFGVHVVAETAGACELTAVSGDHLPGSHVCVRCRNY